MNAHEKLILIALRTMYITRALQLNHSSVIAMSSNHLTIRETKGDSLSSRELSRISQMHF